MKIGCHTIIIFLNLFLSNFDLVGDVCYRTFERSPEANLVLPKDPVGWHIVVVQYLTKGQKTGSDMVKY